MNTLKFKTSIDCGGCVRSITPHLNNIEGIASWKVDTDNPEKILTIETEAVTAEKIMQAVQKAGFKIESLN